MDCNHENKELRFKTDSIGRNCYYYQCMGCGKIVSNMIKASLATGQELPFDQELYTKNKESWRNAWEEQVRQQKEERDRRVAELQAEWEEKKKAYKRYLGSPEWKAKAEKVLARDKYLCQACLERTAIQVHHLTYRHIFNEPLFDLISVCGVCHKSITEMDNAKSN